MGPVFLLFIVTISASLSRCGDKSGAESNLIPVPSETPGDNQPTPETKLTPESNIDESLNPPATPEVASTMTSVTVTSAPTDILGPTISYLAKPPSRSNDTSFTVTAFSDETLTNLSCKVNNTTVTCSQNLLGQITFTTGSLSDGEHRIFVIGSDNSGNSTTADSIFTVDTTAPTLALTQYNPTMFNNEITGSGGTASFTVKFSPSGAGAYDYSYRWKLDSGSWSTSTAANASASFGTTPGTHTFEAKIVDDLGNESSLKTLTWTVLAKYYSTTSSGDTVIKQRVSSGSTYWFTPPFSADTYANANTGCGNLSYGGSTDWTLPSSTIARDWNSGGVANHLSGLNYEFWTSTTSQTVSGTVWKYTNNFSTSGNSGESSYPSNQTRFIRCIRFGP